MPSRWGRSAVLLALVLSTAAWSFDKTVSLLTKQPVGELAVAGRLALDLHAEFMVARTWEHDTVLNWYNCGYAGGGRNNTVGGDFGDFGFQVPADQRDRCYPHAVKLDGVPAVRFDGHQWLTGNFALEPTLSGKAELSLELWFRAEAPTAGEVILGWQAPDGSATSAAIGYPAGLTGSPAWRQLAIVCAGERERWWLDGQSVYDGARKTIVAPGHVLVLGGASSKAPSFRGELAALRLHDRALSDEAREHNRVGGVMLGTELHNWWRLDDAKYWSQESAHFRHAVDRAEMAKWTDKQRQEFDGRLKGMFDLAELVYHQYTERQAYRSSVVSRRPQMRGDGIKYKTPICPANGSWMGVDDDFGWACQGAGFINPHELVHGFDAQTGGAMQGNYWEAHANFPQTYAGIYQTMPPSCCGRVCWVFPANGRDYYHERLMFEHLSQTPAYGPMLIAKLWYDGATPTDKNPLPWEAFTRLMPDGANQLPYEYARMVQRNVTWDYETFEDARGAPGNTGVGNDHAPSKVNLYARDAQANAADLNRFCRVLLTPVLGAADTWRVPKDLAPQQLGWNLCPLTPTAGPVSATLQGFIDVKRGSDWRFSFVSVDGAGKPTYSQIAKAGETLTFNPGADAKELFLTVVATPTNLLAINMVGDFRSFEQEQFPYQVRLTGCQPLDVLRPAAGSIDPRATVEPTAFVAPTARIVGAAKILGHARVLDYAVVQDSTVKDYAVVSGHAEVNGGAVIQDYAKVRDFARVRGATIKDEARLLEHAEEFKGRDPRTVGGHATLKGGAVSFGNVSGTAILDGSYCKGNEITKGKWFTWSWGNGQNAGELDSDFGGLYADYQFQAPHDWMAADNFGATWGYLVGHPRQTTVPELVAYKTALMAPEEVLPALEGKQNFSQHYAERLAGYLLPPADGDYTFWIAADDEGEFRLGPAGATTADKLVCSNPFYAPYRDFRRFPSQKSAPVHLEAGKAYPLEVLHANNHMGDSLTVAWTRPGSDKIEPLGAPYLSVSPDGQRPGVTRRAWAGASFIKDLVKLPDFPSGRVRVSGGALPLNGVNQCVELPRDLVDLRQVTFVMQVKWSGGEDQRLLEFVNDRGDSLSLSPSRGGKLVCELRRMDKVETLVAPALTPETWVRLVVVLNGEQSKLFVDGAQVAVNERMSLRPDDLEATRGWLGRGRAGGWFHGLVASCQVYVLPRTPLELGEG